MDSELVMALRVLLEDVQSGGDWCRSQHWASTKEAQRALSAHDARESSRPGSTDIARGNDWPNVPDRDAVAWMIRLANPGIYEHIPTITMHENDAEYHRERGDGVTPLYTQPPAPQMEIANATLLDAMKDIYQYGADTLSGRTDGPDDRKWQRDAVLKMTPRASAATLRKFRIVRQTSGARRRYIRAQCIAVGTGIGIA